MSFKQNGLRLFLSMMAISALAACGGGEGPSGELDVTVPDVPAESADTPDRTVETTRPGDVSQEALDGPDEEDTQLAATDPYGPATYQSFRSFVETDRVFFDFDESNIRSDARPALRKMAEWLNHHDDVDFTIEGHCDQRGTREYNLALGERRANSVRNFLVAQGVSPSRINTISYGKERLAVPGTTERAHQQNRRGVVQF